MIWKSERENVTLYLGNCLDHIATMNANSIDTMSHRTCL